MTRDEVKNGTRVVFVGPPEGTVVTFFDRENNTLLGKFGTIRYGRSEELTTPFSPDLIISRMFSPR